MILSTEEINGALRSISYQQALEPIGYASLQGGAEVTDNVVMPGQELNFTLDGLKESTGIQFDKANPSGG